MVSRDTDEASKGTNAASQESSGPKQAACLECRRSKIRCVRSPDATTCKRCANVGSECVVPEYHVGRYKGVKNKRSGLDKAIHQVEEAVKKARKGDGGLAEKHAHALEKLLGKSNSPETQTTSEPTDEISSPTEQDTTHFDGLSEVHSNHVDLTRSTTMPSFSPADQPSNTDEVTVNNANNPLELLAIASAIPDQQPSGSTPTVNKTSPSNASVIGDEETINFFSPVASKLDIGPDLDPIDLGLATLTEAKKLFE